MSEENVVTYELEGEIALVGLNRPDKRNCFNPDVMKALRVAIDRAGEEAKCGIIFGHGDNFRAGPRPALGRGELEDRAFRAAAVPVQPQQLFRGDGARQHPVHRGAAWRDARRRIGDGIRGAHSRRR